MKEAGAPLLRQEEKLKARCFEVGVFFLVVGCLFIGVWQPNSLKENLEDFSPREIARMVTVSHEFDGMLPSQREMPVGKNEGESEFNVGAPDGKKLEALGTVNQDACKYAQNIGDMTSEEIQVATFSPNPVPVGSVKEVPADFDTQVGKANTWLQDFLQQVIVEALAMKQKENPGDISGCIVSPGPVKTKERVVQKAMADYMMVMSGRGNIMKVMDVARATVVCQDVSYLLNALKALYKLLAQDAEDGAYLIRIKNKGFGPASKFPEGFTLTKMADITCNLHAPKCDWAVEVQFAILPILLKKTKLHGIYDKFRVLDTPTAVQCYDFMRESQDIMERVWKDEVIPGKADQVAAIDTFLEKLKGCGQEKEAAGSGSQSAQQKRVSANCDEVLKIVGIEGTQRDPCLEFYDGKEECTRDHSEIHAAVQAEKKSEGEKGKEDRLSKGAELNSISRLDPSQRWWNIFGNNLDDRGRRADKK